MELFFIVILCILFTVLLGIFINYLINPIEKRISFTKIAAIGSFLGLIIGLFFYWQQFISV
jgi:uncharacterized protein YqgC (DUF456 family)